MNDAWNLLLVNDRLWVLSASTGLTVYDFDFRAFFPCTTPWQRNKEVVAVGRVGAFDDYERVYSGLIADGVKLVHSPEVHLRISQLPGWYRLLEDVTPRSRWFSEIPCAATVEQDFRWPVFVKGVRQTSRHQRSLAVINTPEEFDSAMEVYRTNSILRWQPVVVREFVHLRPVQDSDPSCLQPSFEFRTFWWRGQCVGAGRYWCQGCTYDWNATERQEALALAENAARRVNACFVVIDVAMTAKGRWIVIECNDGQESGYAGVSPIGLWQKILCIEEEQERH